VFEFALEPLDPAAKALDLARPAAGQAVEFAGGRGRGVSDEVFTRTELPNATGERSMTR
jgi:hypothetical protein